MRYLVLSIQFIWLALTHLSAQDLVVKVNFEENFIERGFDLTQHASAISPIQPAVDFNMFPVKEDPNGLLVSLFDFSIKKTDNGTVLLQWGKSKALISATWILERSEDGRLFTELGSVSSQEKNGQSSDFEYFDNRPLADVSYYRLKIINGNEPPFYSPILVFENASEKKPVTLYPNPVLDHLSLRIAGNKKTIVSIRSANGKRIMQFPKNFNGSFFTTLDISRLPEGNYFLQVIIGSKKYIHPFVKM